MPPQESTGAAEVRARLIGGVDRAAFVVALADRLRRAGVPVTLRSLAGFTEALEAAPPTDLRTLYWLARLTLVTQPHDLPTFDAVFDAAFRGAVLRVDPAARRTGPEPGAGDETLTRARRAGAEQEGEGLPWHTLPTVTADAEEAPAGPVLPELLPSAVARLADTPFDELDEDQLRLVGTWLERALQQWPMRRSRRHRVQPAGRTVALRETLARSRRTGFEAFALARRSPVRRPRPLTMLGDVSQSMQAYCTAYLHLMRAFARSGRAETFVFSTSLTRVTPALAHRSAQVAMARAAEQVVDRYGGTHLATSLRTLLRSRHGQNLRGGVLVIASDGWDSDDPELLSAVLARVRLRTHRVIWLNPRAAAPGFEPLVGSMAAALPYCDVFLPGHTVRALGDVIDAIAVAQGPASSTR